MKSVSSRFRHLLCVALLSVIGLRGAAAGFHRNALLPENSLVTIEFSDSAAFFIALGKTAAGRMWKDPGIQAFLGNPDLQTLITDLLFSERCEEQKLLYRETLDMLGNETMVAFTPGSTLPTLVAAMPREYFLRSLEIDQRIAELTQDGVLTIVRHTFDDVEIIQHIKEFHDQSEQQVTWQAHLDNTLIYGPDRAWVESSIARLRREAPAEGVQDVPTLALRLNTRELTRLLHKISNFFRKAL